MRRLVVALTAVAALLATSAGAMATPVGLDSDQQAYRAAIVEARGALLNADQDESARAATALAILKQRAAGERDAIAALQSQPPDIAGAADRLRDSLFALDQAGREPDPATARQHLREILAQPRYHPTPGPLAAVLDAVARALEAILRALFGTGSTLERVVKLLLAGGLLALLVLLTLPGIRRALMPGGRKQPRANHAVDGLLPQYFREADALAASGDYAAAVRALAAGVMEELSGQRSFVASPLTVREVFGRAGATSALQPLQLAFESSYYGHHEVSADGYRSAAAAVTAFRLSRQEEVAA